MFGDKVEDQDQSGRTGQALLRLGQLEVGDQTDRVWTGSSGTWDTSRQGTRSRKTTKMGQVRRTWTLQISRRSRRSRSRI